MLEKSVVCPILIGRASALQSLERAIETAHAGQGQAVVLAGEAGVGKTRLATEAKAHAAGKGFTILQGRCFEPDRALPYAPLLDLLRAYCARHSPAEIARNFGDAAPDLIKLLPEQTTLFPNVAPSPAAGPEQEKRRLFDSLIQFFKRLPQPLLIIVEDLHWSDEASIEFLLHFARRLAPQPCLLILTYRTDELHAALNQLLAGLDRERIAAEIILSRLNIGEVGAMLRAIFDLSRPARADFLEAIYTLTEGNPFFVEEVLKSLVVAGDIFYADGAWDRKPLKDLHTLRARTVQVAVQQRTDLLSPAARQLLTLAAVAGRRFDFALLQALTKLDEAGLVQLVKELIRAQLVVEESADVFAFRHALTRQAVYADMLARERRALHRSIAETMVGTYHDSLEAHLSDLAYHFYEAGLWEKAVGYSQRAGEKAAALYSPRAAVEQFSHALESARQLAAAPSPHLLRMRGQAYETLGDFENARADFESALELAGANGDRQAEWQALLGLGALWAARDYARTGDYFQRALLVARALGDPTTLARTLNRVGNWHVNNERPLEAQQYHHEARRIFETSNDRRGLAETLDLLGTAYFSCVDMSGAAYYRQAAAIFRELNDRQALASTLSMLPLRGPQYLGNVTAWPEDNVADCLRDGEEAIRIAREIGWRAGEALALAALGSPLGVHGDYGRALESIQSGLAIAEEIGHHFWITFANLILGAVYLDLLALPAARQCLEQALTMAQAFGSLYWARTVAGFLVPTYIVQADLKRASAVLGSVLPPDAPLPPDNTALTMGQRQSWCARAELALAQKDPARALQVVEMLTATTPNIERLTNGAVPRLAQVRGEAFAMVGRNDEAETALQAGLKTALAGGARSIAWRLHLALGRLYREGGRLDEAEREWTAGRRLVEELAATVPDPSLRENFVRHAIESIPSPSPRRAAKQAFGGLTGREREVAALVARGKSNRAIADELVVSERTVEKHVENALSKLGFASRAQLAAWAVEKGLGSVGSGEYGR